MKSNKNNAIKPFCPANLDVTEDGPNKFMYNYKPEEETFYGK